MFYGYGKCYKCNQCFYGGFEIRKEGLCCTSCETPLKINKLSKDKSITNILPTLKSIALEDYKHLYPQYGYGYMLDIIFKESNPFDLKIITFQDNDTLNMLKFRKIILNIDMMTNNIMTIDEYHEFICLYLKSRISNLQEEEKELVENVVKGSVVLN